MNYKTKSWLYSFLLHVIFLFFFYHWNNIKNITDNMGMKPIFFRSNPINIMEDDRKLHSIPVFLVNQNYFNKYYNNGILPVSRTAKKAIIINRKIINYQKENTLTQVLNKLHEKKNKNFFNVNRDIYKHSQMLKKEFFSNNLLHETILKNLKEKIIQCWHVPPDFSLFSNSQITINLTLNSKGYVTHVNILKITGNPLFTKSLKRSVLDIFKQKSCQIFQLPINEYAIWNHIEITFSPNDLQ